MSGAELPDGDIRDRLIRSRRNVFIDAGAGTGKTYTIVERLLELAAPQDSGQTVLDISRIAAITFTRRAAGELKTRLRSRCLSKLRKASDSGNRERERRLTRVLENLSSAFVGTIHSFADRLLSQRPVESGLSPSYRIEENTERLVAVTFETLMNGVRRGSLEDEFSSPPEDVHLEEVAETVHTLLNGGVPEEDQGEGYRKTHGLEGLIRSWIQSRDRPEPSATHDLDLARVHRGIQDLLRPLRRLEDDPDRAGIRFLKGQVQPVLEKAKNLEDPAELFVWVNRLYGAGPLSGSGKYGHLNAGDFGNDRAKGIQASLSERTDGDILKTSDYCPTDPTYRERILTPLRRWMATRLIPVRRVTLDLYEQIKRDRGVVDQADLLIQLRNLLRDDPGVRRDMQQMFDHILVDEFQDTDPLQCEIVFFLSEDPNSSPARRWHDVHLEEGSLTFVGDPKQSIYRFRRADIQVFANAAIQLENRGADTGTLRTNFRSDPRLIEVFNRCFGEFLGRPDPGHKLAYNHQSGEALYEDVVPCPWFETNRSDEVLTFLRYDADGRRKPETMQDEARLVADYIEQLTGNPDPSTWVRDPDGDLDDPDHRPCRPSDIAILGPSTYYFDTYLREFSRRGLACTVAGGSTFLEDDAVKQYILALRALADPSDGVAQAALKRPPFFATDYDDLLTRHPEAHKSLPVSASERRQDMEEVIRELRRRSRQRSPLETALDLIDQTVCSRFWSSEPNGSLKLVSLYHVAAWLDQIARQQGLDFDEATQQLRGWLEESPDVNAPAPLDEEAVRLMTTYQAKGLEYPVVFLFDGRSRLRSARRDAFQQDKSGERFFYNLQAFKTEVSEEHDSSLYDREKDMVRAESKRLLYVAATRARDRLVVPWPDNVRGGTPVYQTLFEPVKQTARIVSSEDLSDRVTPERSDSGIPGSGPIEYSERRTRAMETRLNGLREGITEAVSDSLGVTSPHKKMAERFGGEARDFSTERFGRAFGRVVHSSLERLLRTDPDEKKIQRWIEVALAEETEPIRGEDQVEQDVRNALRTLREHTDLEGTLRPEFPVTYRRDGEIVSGVIDLVVRTPERIWVVDYKTDPAPETVDRTREQYPEYVYQLSFYEEALEAMHTSRPIHTALLFTQTGDWFETTAD